MNDHNFIVENEHFHKSDPRIFATSIEDDSVEPWEFIPPEWSLLDILVKVGVFASKSKARQNWIQFSKKAGIDNYTIPQGYSEIKNVGKLRHSIYILSPVPCSEPCSECPPPKEPSKWANDNPNSQQDLQQETET